MNRPMTETDCIRRALEPYGFADGKYGDIPFKLQFSSFPHKGETSHYHVVISGRVIAEVGVRSDGTYPVRMQLSEWLKGPRTLDDDYREAVARRAFAISSRRHLPS